MGTKRLALVLAATLAVVHAGCTDTVWQARFVKPQGARSLTAEDERGYLKVHTFDGRVYVLGSGWTLDADRQQVSGTGIEYSATRDIAGPTRAHTIPYDRVALLETNRPETVEHSGLLVMGVVAGASLAVTAICLTNPKTCFGSCPTFYAPGVDGPTLQAEGFSASIARAFEATDVDPLYGAQHAGGVLDIRMTNEALETHAVRSVRVWSAPRPPGGRLVHAGEALVGVTQFAPPTGCDSLVGDCVALVRDVDDLAYRSPTDGKDLSTKETVDLDFAGKPGPKGIVIAGKMGLLTTFLLYQALAYLGHDAGEWLVRLERGEHQVFDMARAMHDLLGDVAVEVQTRDGAWVHAGAFYEMGPIAREVQLVPLPEGVPEDRVRVRLRMTRGDWKIDQVALVTVGSQVEASVHEVREVLRGEHADADALARLSDPERVLVTYPGDAYVLRFDVPEGDRELFLQTRGYYYEWMRSQWLAEEDHAAALGFLVDPHGTLKRLAPEYKRLEPAIEELFWKSRIGASR